MRALAEYLKSDYLVLSMDFQEASTEDFVDETAFVRAFAEMVIEAFGDMGVDREEEVVKSILPVVEDVILAGVYDIKNRK